ncbi:hypothetical protein DF220_07855 [Salinibacterium hongtaonis]|uniref:IclR-ED domain-containing protein n=2 Tax=Homoserinimonas hongtaonis TaxID=2079791 RepID=A0A2U1T1N0_9MICO|nr:hypothetical protein DF220_07855 [Salinibacterium hongtaonis]
MTMSLKASELWRAVLAEYPTGVALVTAQLPDGSPVGMVVGSFTAISQDPPLVGYFGDDSSSTFQSIVGADRFAVSVFADSHDSLLRSFVRKDEGRYEQSGLTTTDSGLIRLDDAVVWFEARTQSVQRHGDHQLVVGAVVDFGVSTSDIGSPLLYRRGGFGAFAIPAEAVDARLIGDRLAAAQAAAEVLAPIASRLSRDIAVTALVGDSVVVVGMVPSAPVAPGESPPGTGPLRAIGISLPFAAPVEPLFAAWAHERVRSFWMERARHLVGAVDRRQVEARLEAIRRRGFGVSVDQDLTARFIGTITDPSAERESYAQIWSEYAAQTIVSTSSILTLSDIAAVQVPVFDEHGQVALVLTVSDLGPFADEDALNAFADTLIAAADAASHVIARGPRGRS